MCEREDSERWTDGEVEEKRQQEERNSRSLSGHIVQAQKDFADGECRRVSDM